MKIYVVEVGLFEDSAIVYFSNNLLKAERAFDRRVTGHKDQGGVRYVRLLEANTDVEYGIFVHNPYPQIKMIRGQIKNFMDEWIDWDESAGL